MSKKKSIVTKSDSIPSGKIAVTQFAYNRIKLHGSGSDFEDHDRHDWKNNIGQRKSETVEKEVW